MVYYAAADIWNRNIKHKYHTNLKEAMIVVKLMELYMYVYMKI